VNFLNLVQFFQFLKGRCHGNQFSGKNGAKLPTPPALIAMSFQNGMEYRLANMRINSSTNCSTSCEKMVKIGSVVFELKWQLKMKTVLQTGQNWPILPNISITTEPVFTNVSAFVDVHMCIIKLT